MNPIVLDQIVRQQEDIESLRQQLAATLAACKVKDEALERIRGHLNLYNLFSCVGSDSYDPECADLNAGKCREIAIEALAATADLDGLILCHAEPCRDDGRCQYAIDHGAEGLGHCSEGKCCMPLYRAWEPTK